MNTMRTAAAAVVAPVDKSSQSGDRHRNEINATSEPERYDVLVLGSGTAGKLIAWTMAREGKRTASIERRYIGGACPTIACLPSKNVIHTAKVASLFGRHQEFSPDNDGGFGTVVCPRAKPRDAAVEKREYTRTSVHSH